jgi:hypothetical protein
MIESNAQLLQSGSLLFFHSQRTPGKDEAWMLAIVSLTTGTAVKPQFVHNEWSLFKDENSVFSIEGTHTL